MADIDEDAELLVAAIGTDNGPATAAQQQQQPQDWQNLVRLLTRWTACSSLARCNSTSSTGSPRRRHGRYATSPYSRRALSTPSYSPYTTPGYGFINNFGQTPKQLFKKPHPAKKVSGLTDGSRISSGIEIMTLPLVAGQAAMQILPIHLPSTGDGSS